ncbi:DUF4856 domain-containing protein [Pseudoalteromonas rubra]|uniref:DUF4856 domain-containing protein n=1 Tax=Pseudoalteromonas rubra TaxID=43658 RepID=A0A5S3WJE0_9GAMM|nr:DUF4856 domain-containing protein [Pseudoalteromonas rubra]TMP27410.1 DUF4856 domain-containing protein [Pseudoalteromonas rubra]TMP36948.1 DUF4856 domain-containing protein [Pseudoalteromonas rubra]
MIFKKSLLATSILVATLGLTACGGSSSNDNNTQTPDPTTPTTPTTNEAPTALTLKSQDSDATEVTVTENMVAVEIGNLVVTDGDDDTHTFTVSDERFEVANGVLKLKAGEHLNYELEQEVKLTVTVKDSADNEQSFEIVFKVLDEMDYDFISRFEEGQSSVAYSGQIARHVLIKELFNYIGSNNDEYNFENDAKSLDKAALVAKLNEYFSLTDAEYASKWGSERKLTISTDPAALQPSLSDISSSHKDLNGKVAGNDAKGQYKDWTEDGSFVGWTAIPADGVKPIPQLFVEELFSQLADRALAANAEAPGGDEISTIYVTEQGVDLNQLIQKFLYGAVAFSQAADDYLDYDTEGKGLMTDNTVAVDGKAYTNLEHQWDEGYGYFGAARNYMSYTDDEIAGKGGRDGFSAGHNDANNDGKIDFNAEYNFGNSTNAAKRDRGTVGNTNPTDLTKDAFEALYNGRKLINSTEGALTDAQMDTLKGHAKDALLAWEKSISATVVHYINDTIKDLDTLVEGVNGGVYTGAQFSTLAKHWSEMKGFALNFQFNRHSPFFEAGNEGKFAEMHDLMGTQPVIAVDGVDAYKADLLKARDILQEVYGFDAENVANW